MKRPPQSKRVGILVYKFLQGDSNHAWAVTFSPDGKLLTSASDDNTVRLWGPATGASLHTLNGNSESVQCSDILSPNGRLVASASEDKTVRLWDIKTMKTIAYFTLCATVFRLSFVNNGSHLVTDEEIIEIVRSTLCSIQPQSLSFIFCAGKLALGYLENSLFLMLPPDH